MNLRKFNKSTKNCNKKLMSWRLLTRQFSFNVENVHFVLFRLLKERVETHQIQTLQYQQKSRRNILILNLSSVVERASNKKNDVKKSRLKWLWTLIIKTTKQLRLITFAFASMKRSLIMYMFDLTISQTIFTKSDKM